tara:strand:- start:1154 stop:2197 length:1044 start_codon:yes stop_codon:yes gene_type:complete
MNSNSLIDKLGLFWNKQHPFVSFRLPNSDEVCIFYQKDNLLNSTHDLLVSGFIISPFLNSKLTHYIPADFSEIFPKPYVQAKERDEIKITEEISEKTNFIELVERAKNRIESGIFKKVVVSRLLTIHSEKKPVDLFLALENKYPETLVYLWHHPKVGTWLGATPEQLVAITVNATETMSLAGTQLYEANKTPRWTSKERDEQALVTEELFRNLNTMFSSDEIEAEGPLNQRAGNLVHLCTHFKMPRLKEPLHLLTSTLHPTPAVGGLPKKEAQEFIEMEEGYDRLFYTGFLGPISKEKTHLFVNLRCAQWKEEKLTLYVGAGITAGSIAENEWLETQLKAETFTKIL